MRDEVDGRGADVTAPPGESVRVVDLDALAVGEMRSVVVDGRRLVLARTASGYGALDHACPHQGYGLATGTLDGELITCRWHNWKFAVSDGRCVQGEEDVLAHQVEMVTGDGHDDRERGVYVTVRTTSQDEVQARLWPSLQRGIERAAGGQIARDTVRLLESGAAPEEIVRRAVTDNLRRTERGPDHELAVVSDVLALAVSRSGTDRALPLVHGLAGLADATHHRAPSRVPATPRPDLGGGVAAFVAAIEAEDHAAAAGRALARLTGPDGDPGGPGGPGGELGGIDAVRGWFVAAVSEHHLSYGHGAIYVHKAFELLERVPALAPLVVDELTTTIINATREDTLPYMRGAAAAIRAVDVERLAAVSASPVDAARTDALVAESIDAPTIPLDALVAHGMAHGVGAVLDVVSLTAARRMLAYDLAVEIDPTIDFGWLDLTHALTYANAARWLSVCEPGPVSARLALWTVWLAFDAGRRHRSVPAGEAPSGQAPADDSSTVVPTLDAFRTAIRMRHVDAAVAGAWLLPVTDVADSLEAVALDDIGGSFIVAAHAIKTAVAARAEAAATGSRLALVAATRFLAAPRIERFVARNTAESVAFVTTGRPPRR